MQKPAKTAKNAQTCAKHAKCSNLRKNMQKFGVKNNQKLQLFQNVPNQKKEQLGEKIVQVVSVAFATFSISGVIDTE